MRIAQESDQNQICFLTDISQRNAWRFGGKTEGLVTAINAGADVPNGFAVSFELAARIAEAKDQSVFRDILARFVENLLKEDPAATLIIRSSSAFEAGSKAAFSGVFESHKGIRTVDSVAASIAKIVRSARSPSLDHHYRRFSADPKAAHMAVIVQAQIRFDIGGIAQFSGEEVMVEFGLDDFSSALAGRNRIFHFRMGSSGGLVSDEFSSKSLAAATRRIAAGLRAQRWLWQMSKRTTVAIEFGICGGSFVVLQLEYSSPVIGCPDATARATGKVRAIEHFARHGLFSKAHKIVRAGWDAADVETQLAAMLSKGKAVTIRFAQGSSIGLPRAFVSTLEDAIKFVCAMGKTEYDIIIHEYIDVEHSFEILISRDGFVLEHIPGMWESPNRLQPDVIVSTAGSTTSYRYLRRRAIVGGRKGAGDGTQLPLSREQMHRFRQIGEQVRACLIDEMPECLPLNVHAVWDRSSGTYQCLNIRPGFYFHPKAMSLGDLQHIGSVAEIAQWDGRKPVRLALTTNRGEEASLLAVAERLAQAPFPIVIDFGLLSHPAMVLRQYGCTLLPSYLLPECFDDGEYEVLTFATDSDFAPVDRILAEPACLQSDRYHVVLDRDPLADPHFLAVAKEWTPSAFDSGAVCEVARLYGLLSGGAPALFYERGRATFCTSGFTRPHDHFHVLRGVDVGESVGALKEAVGGLRYATLEAAYQNVPPIGEYTVYGTDGFGFFVRTGVHGEKRVLKHCVRWLEDKSAKVNW